MVSVIAPYQGASPDVVEKQVVEPLEDDIQARRRHHERHLDGQRGLRPSSWRSSTTATSSKHLVADVQQAVNRARAQLPDDVDPQVVAGSTDDIPTVVLAVSSDKDQQSLADQLDSTVVPVLKDIDGVGQVTVDGVQDQVVAVTPDDKKLAAAGLTAAALGQALQAGGASVPAGSFAEDGKSKTVQVGAGFTSVKQIQDLSPRDGRRAAAQSGAGQAGPPR